MCAFAKHQEKISGPSEAFYTEAIACDEHLTQVLCHTLFLDEESWSIE